MLILMPEAVNAAPMAPEVGSLLWMIRVNSI